MSLKIEGKDWSCNNQCKSSCCEEVFLPLSKEQRNSFENTGSWEVNQNYSDFRWLEFHKNLKIRKLKGGNRVITFLKNVPFNILYNPYKNNEEIHIIDRCVQLLPDKRCKVYRNRPEICKKALCPVFDIKASIQFYAKNGLLKDKYEEYKRGELKKW